MFYELFWQVDKLLATRVDPLWVSLLVTLLVTLLVRSWQDLRTILAKIMTRSCQRIHFAMVRSSQESHVPKKNFIEKSVNKNQHLHQQIYIVRHDNFLLPRYKI